MPLFPPNKTPILDRPLLFVDLEMTGLDPKKHEIIEISALKVSQPDFAIDNSYYTKVIPTHLETAEPKSLQISGYDPHRWMDAIPLGQMLAELSQFAPDSILVGWGVFSEWDFLIAALESQSLPYFFTNLIDVSSIAYSRLYTRPGFKSLGLAKTCRLMGISLENHNADSDIRATYEIFKKLLLSSSVS